MIQKTELEFQADRIEAVLAVHEVPARVTGGTVVPHWVRFQVLPVVGAKISKIKGLSEELAAALGVSSCRVSRRGAAVAIEVPRDDPQPVRFTQLHRQLMASSVDGCYSDKEGCPQHTTALLGLAEDGAPLLIRLPSPDVGHILISGVEGAGKTTLLCSIITSLALAGDPNEIAFCFWGDIVSMAEPVRRLGFQVLAGLEWSTIILGALRAAGKHGVVVADDICRQGPRFPKLARVMGYEKLHFVLAWNGVPPKGAVNLFKVRLVGKVNDAEDARTATGWSGTGAERLLGRGDFLAVAEGLVIRFQAALVTPE